MKKIILSLFVFGFLAVGVSQAQASVLGDLINQINSLRSKMTASVIDSTTGRSIAGTPTDDLTPRIMYWWGKVNQHVDLKTGQWESDPDGKSGTNLSNLTYCKKWYPNTVSVKDYQYETINTWRAGGNTGEYSSTKMSYECVQETLARTITIESNPQSDDNGNVTIKKGEKITITGYPNSLTGQLGVDYQRAFSFGPKFECYNAEGWVLNCTAQETGTSSFYITLYQGDKTYTSNIIKVNVVESSTPLITVLSPNGGEGYNPYDEMTVKWSSQNISSSSLINIYLINTSNNLETPLITNTPNDGIQGTVLSNEATFGKDYKLKIVASNGISDTSDSYFKIYQPTTNSIHSVILSNPSEGRTYTSGQKITVVWNTQGFLPTDSVGLAIVDKDNRYPFSLLTVNDGQETITLPIINNTSTYTFFIKVDGSQVAASDESIFTIIGSSNIKSSITVISPNLGESYKLGDKVVIKWIASNVKDNKVSIDLRYPSSPEDSVYSGSYEIVSGIYNSGTYNWIIPSELKIYLPDSNQYINLLEKGTYKIAIYDEGYPRAVDYSDKPFTITSSVATCANGATNPPSCTLIPTNTPSITVLSPNGGESYKIGDNVPIKLNIVNPNKLPVAISLTYPGAVKDLLGINGDLVGDSYTWKIPENIAPGNYLIKGSIYSCDANLSCNSILQDSSNNSFTISSSTTSVNCPAGYIYDPYTGKLCSSASISPTSSLLPQCSDNKDNDFDGALDRGDTQCHFGASLYKAYLNNFDSESSDELSRIRVLRLTFPLMTGEDVKALQENLGLIPADGVYGYNTYNAVKSWQMRNGLMADGIFGPACYNQMYLELFKLKNSL